MPVKDYIIAIGGTGARCLEATIYLAATGLFENDLHMLMINPDQNNGNTVRTRKLLPLYHALSLLEQPKEAKQRRYLKTVPLQEQILFRPLLNSNDQDKYTQYPFFWQDPNSSERKFSEAINYAKLSSDMKHFVRLFYEEADLDMRLGKGYRGRPNVGAVTLTSDLERTKGAKGKGLAEFINSLRADLKSSQARVFVFGSVFGGTGAAGLPTIPDVLQEALAEGGNTKNLRFGCAMMTPYFTFPKATSASSEGPTPDSDLHQVATQAALLHYAHVPPNYQHVYVVGAPELPETNADHTAGGDKQENNPHYAEIIAVLGARDFFSIPTFESHERRLHYADGASFSWTTLPTVKSEGNDQAKIKRRILNFTTFAYFYQNILHTDLKGVNWYLGQAWYKDNFIKKGLTLNNEGQTLDKLAEFLESYLKWLHLIGDPISGEKDAPINWSSLLLKDRDAERELGKLSRQEQGNEPRYAQKSYGELMERLTRLTPTYNGKVDPVGLLIYLLYEAVSEFCRDNYSVSNQVN